MLWLVVFAVFTLVGAVGTVLNVNRVRFERRFAREMQALVSVPASGVAHAAAVELPPPVARYRQLAVGDRGPVRGLRLRHSGSFRLSPSARLMPIQGTQAFTADPPGFLWLGRVNIGCGMWLHARDMLVQDRGSMLVLLGDTLKLADGCGPEFDQGSALRLLAEMAWYPTAFFDARSVTWAPIDANHALATLRLGALAVSGTFEFGPDGLPLGMHAQRFMDKSGLREWSGVYRDWRTVSGLRVPFEAEVSWQMESGPYTYAHWRVDSVEYD
jgi:hypothetical protein